MCSESCANRACRDSAFAQLPAGFGKDHRQSANPRVRALSRVWKFPLLAKSASNAASGTYRRPRAACNAASCSCRPEQARSSGMGWYRCRNCASLFRPAHPVNLLSGNACRLKTRAAGRDRARRVGHRQPTAIRTQIVPRQRRRLIGTPRILQLERARRRVVAGHLVGMARDQRQLAELRGVSVEEDRRRHRLVVVQRGDHRPARPPGRSPGSRSPRREPRTCASTTSMPPPARLA